MKTHDLSYLHTILSTGSPLKPQSYDYVYTHIKENVLLGSITGVCVRVCVCVCGQSQGTRVCSNMRKCECMFEYVSLSFRWYGYHLLLRWAEPHSACVQGRDSDQEPWHGCGVLE